MSSPSRPGYHSVKIRDDGFERLNRLVSALSQHGWSAVGVQRSDRVSSLSVLDLALDLLEKRLKTRR